jgi:ribosomal protein L37AE/L43A
MSQRPKLSKLKELYQKVKEAKVGETVCCPSCKTEFVKKSYQQIFCKSKTGTTCKDFYWNNVTPSKRNNTTRISPANARFYALHIEPLKDSGKHWPMGVDEGPEGWDGHKDTM